MRWHLQSDNQKFGTGDCSKAAVYERVNLQKCGTLIIDDVVVADAGSSRMYAQLVRSLFDGTARAVQGKIRHPRSSAIFTVKLARPL